VLNVMVVCFGYLLFWTAPLVLLFMPTSQFTRWLTLGFAIWILGAAFPSYADLPPYPLILPFALWAAAAYRHWLRPKVKEFPPGYCGGCGYNLTGNVSGICPECGRPIDAERRG